MIREVATGQPRVPTQRTGSGSSGAPGDRPTTRSRELQDRLHEVVPGGAHTYAKGSDQYPEGMAPVIARGQGARVWDVDGNEYVEYGSGLRAVALGHVHPGVTAAARAALELGANFARPAAIELEAAESLLALVPDADMVKFAKNGSDATTAAVRLARAVTGRDTVAICRDHPFFSTDDWFIGTSPMKAGIPDSTRAQSLTFPYGDLVALATLLDEHPNEIAALIMEPARSSVPPDGYFDGVRRLCDEHGTLLVLDEMITGFRWATGGAQSELGIRPDLSTFGKALGNGYAVSALAGRREHMQRGGFDQDHDRVFLLSTTHGAETHALAAAMAVITAHQEEDVVATLDERGRRLSSLFEQATAAAGVEEHLRLDGPPCNLVYATLDPDGRPSQEYRTVFLAELLKRGVLAPSLVVSTALSDADLELTADAVFAAGLVYRRALMDGVSSVLDGRPVRPAVRRRG